jgi:hypothetical protein
MTPKIQAALDQLLHAIREETVASFSALLTSGTTAMRAPAARSPRAPSKSSGKRTAEDLAEIKTTLLSVIRKQPGLRTEQIAKEIGATTKDLQLPMLQLREEKSIRMKGQKRAAQYFAR